MKYTVLSFLLLASLSNFASLEASQVNIVVVLSDDHRADYLGVAGHPILKTPNIDRLANEGLYFQMAINPAGAAKVTVDVALRKGSILVKNAASGEPIPNHCIDLHIAKWPWRTTMVTDKNGIIEVVLPEGTYLLKTSLDQAGKHFRAMYSPGDVHFSQNNLDLDSTELDWTGPTLPTSIEIKLNIIVRKEMI